MKALKELNAKYGAGEVCDQQEPLIDRLRKTASKGVSVWGDLMLEAADALAQPAQEPVAREWNFCERCGKRTKDLTTIHTCTPPQEGK